MTLAHQSPIVDSIVFNIIREFHFEKFKFSKREIIDSSIVPSFSENILKKQGFQESSFRQVSLPPVTLPAFGKSIKTEEKKVEPQLPESSNIPEGYQESIMRPEKPIPFKEPIQKQITPLPVPRVIQVPRPPQMVAINLFQNPPNYGKLNMVMRDHLVQFIECPGPDKKLVVTKKDGLKQQTNIILSKEEINMLLSNISTKTKIPLITGVFRVSWDSFIINAVISDILEPRFLIKKVA